MFVQAWNIQLCLHKLSRFIIYSYGKSVLSSTDFNLNAWGGYTNDIRQDLAENKSWLKVVCTCRNINTVNWRYGHKLACFTLEQIRKSWILLTKILPVARFKFRNFLLVYVSRKLLKRQPADILNPEDNTGKWCISEYSILIAYRANNWLTFNIFIFILSYNRVTLPSTKKIVTFLKIPVFR